MKNSQKKVIEQWYILPLILVASSVSKLSLGQFGYNCVISFISFLCHLQSIQSSRLVFSVVKHEVVGVVGSSVSVPCNCTPSYSNTRDSPVLILWYKDRAKLPIYRSVRRINPVTVKTEMEIFKLIPITSRIAFSDWNSIMTVFSSAEVSPDRTLHLAAGSTQLIKF